MKEKILNKNVTSAAIPAFFCFVFVGGLLQVGDYSFPVIIDRIFTAGIQTVMVFAAMKLIISLIEEEANGVY